jgi:hypothetical protein
MQIQLFKGNKGHSNAHSNLAIDSGPVDDAAAKFPLNGPSFGGDAVSVIQDFTGYKCTDRNLWFRMNRDTAAPVRLVGSILADNTGTAAALMAFNTVMQESLVVGWSLNDEGKSRPAVGLILYDGPNVFDGMHFAGFPGDQKSPAHALFVTGGALKSHAHRLKRISYAPNEKWTPESRFSVAMTPSNSAERWGSLVHDADGSLSGESGSRILVPRLDAIDGVDSANFNIPLNADKTPMCTPHKEYKVWVCPDTVAYATLDIQHGFPLQFDGTGGMEIKVVRSDGPSIMVPTMKRPNIQLTVLTGRDLTYTLQYTSEALSAATSAVASLHFARDKSQSVRVQLKGFSDEIYTLNPTQTTKSVDEAGKPWYAFRSDPIKVR